MSFSYIKIQTYTLTNSLNIYSYPHYRQPSINKCVNSKSISWRKYDILDVIQICKSLPLNLEANEYSKQHLVSQLINSFWTSSIAVRSCIIIRIITLLLLTIAGYFSMKDLFTHLIVYSKGLHSQFAQVSALQNK